MKPHSGSCIKWWKERIILNEEIIKQVLISFLSIIFAEVRFACVEWQMSITASEKYFASYYVSIDSKYKKKYMAFDTFLFFSTPSSFHLHEVSVFSTVYHIQFLWNNFWLEGAPILENCSSMIRYKCRRFVFPLCFNIFFLLLVRCGKMTTKSSQTEQKKT